MDNESKMLAKAIESLTGRIIDLSSNIDQLKNSINGLKQIVVEQNKKENSKTEK